MNASTNVAIATPPSSTPPVETIASTWMGRLLGLFTALMTMGFGVITSLSIVALVQNDSMSRSIAGSDNSKCFSARDYLPWRVLLAYSVAAGFYCFTWATAYREIRRYPTLTPPILLMGLTIGMVLLGFALGCLTINYNPDLGMTGDYGECHPAETKQLPLNHLFMVMIHANAVINFVIFILDWVGVVIAVAMWCQSSEPCIADDDW